ncbi:glycoside hydrolase family 2 protein [Brumicola blandensis]|uniref:Glycoside hydrolase family 2 TIM barrel-domain containing protein n=1 Tax=Brumicola blandensis TaxID=3075611 RepID=A0AAW8R1A8_9ALTE|nr:glycoside hydrolase family 2 TIM barrel-domain containing protein [Alteromonas sp. W409]MDT0582209.1 glycoside hydrolase family 2 TIM barrel-domain containing protein [Alteromonas sp. W409]
MINVHPPSLFRSSLLGAKCRAHAVRMSFGPVLFAICLVLVSLGAHSASPKAKVHAEVTPFNDSWEYLQENHRDIALARKSRDWSAISLPHTWNATDTMDAEPGYRRNASWYKKTFKAEAFDGVTHLYFEGANFETQVYLNGKLAGEHVGGYVGFTIDLTKYLKTSGNNELLVRVSNRYNRNLIPSQKSDFFLFGGITRDVWLKRLPQKHIDYMAITTPSVSAESASTEVKVDVVADEAASFTVMAEIIAPSGERVQRQTIELLANKGMNSTKLNFEAIKQPILWSIDEPNLYQMKLSLLDANKKELHTKLDTFGYRWFEMKPHKGFFLNGERVLIRGTHRHEEHAGLGAALPNELHRKDMQMMKDMGANFVRLGHYPQDPEVYKAANELGLLIWDELPWCRGGKGGAEWEKNTEYLWQAQVKQNINHPSIIFWSLGNEIYWEEDFEGGGATELINPYLEKLNTMTKEMDPYRLTSIRKYYPGSDIVDAFSPSIWAGWYGGSYSQYEEALKDAHAKYPTFMHMEYGGSSHVGRHTETPISPKGLRNAQVSVSEAVNQAVVRSVAKDSDWNSNYIVDLFDWHLNVSENLPDFAGNAQWAFKDFGTPLRPLNPIPYTNMKGLVDRSGNFKDAYYVFASYWKKEPFCWIESHTWTHRNGPKEGRDVTVYCNTDSAELFLNGESLGKKEKQQGVVPAGGLVWKVPFNNGENTLSVNGFKDGEKVAEDEHVVTYLIGKHGKFKTINLQAENIEGNRWLITAEAIDKEGNRVLDYSERAYFFNIGEQGKLVKDQGTPYGSSTIDMASGFAAIEYIDNGKTSTIEYRGQNVKGVYVEITPN